MKVISTFFILLSCFCNTANAQTIFTLKEAIQTALANNLELKIAENDNKISHNNNHIGNAGMLPDVSLNASGSPSITNINQKFTNGTTIERNGVLSNNVSANLLAVYTLYDGSKMFAQRNKLEAEQALSDFKLKANIQKIIADVIFAYSNIVRQTEYLKVLNQLQNLSEERLTLVKQRLELGLANNSDLFLAELDNETNYQNIIAQNAIVKNAFTSLNVILNLKTDNQFTVQGFAPSGLSFNKSSLDSALKSNPDFELVKQQLEVAKQGSRIIHSAGLPLLKLSGAYNYNFSQSQAGFSLFNQTSGPQVGLTLSVPLFSGNVNSVNSKNAKIEIENQSYRMEMVYNDLNAMLEQTWSTYESLQKQLNSDSIATQTAKQYIDLMQQRFALGQNTIIELKEAQRTFEATNYRMINNQYLFKLTETQLLVLAGQLVN